MWSDNEGTCCFGALCVRLYSDRRPTNANMAPQHNEQTLVRIGMAPLPPLFRGCVHMPGTWRRTKDP